MAAIQVYEGAVDRGLEGVVACSTGISAISGSTLLYRGHRIEELAENCSFEEVIHLLWYGDLPNLGDLARLKRELSDSAALPQEAFPWLLSLPKKVHPMDFLHAVVACLTLHDPDANVLSRKATLRKAIRLTARLSGIVTAFDRVRNGAWPVQPHAEDSIARGFLRGLRNADPPDEEVRDLDICLVLHADHELNASAFSARVTSSTLSGIYSSIMAAIGTLKGPLHGGANEAVMRMLTEIGSLDRADAYLDRALANNDKVMGFGHRVYKDGDPRARILKEMSHRLTQRINRPELFEISDRLEKRMAEEKGLIPNVDFYSASVYYALGIPTDLFTPLFASSRVAGWCAHVLEQYEDNRIYRPRGRYVGPPARDVSAIKDR